jgi:DNA repair protein RadC
VNSRNPNPSDADRRMHDPLTEAGKILGFRVLDHVIVTRQGHFSFQTAGLIKG